MTSQGHICLVYALHQVGYEEVAPILEQCIRRNHPNLTICPHRFTGRDARQALLVDCRGPILLVCSDEHMKAIEALDESDILPAAVIGLCEPYDARMVCSRRAYAPCVEQIDIAALPAVELLLQDHAAEPEVSAEF